MIQLTLTTKVERSRLERLIDLKGQKFDPDSSFIFCSASNSIWIESWNTLTNIILCAPADVCASLRLVPRLLDFPPGILPIVAHYAGIFVKSVRQLASPFTHCRLIPDTTQNGILWMRERGNGYKVKGYLDTTTGQPHSARPTEKSSKWLESVGEWLNKGEMSEPGGSISFSRETGRTLYLENCACTYSLVTHHGSQLLYDQEMTKFKLWSKCVCALAEDVQGDIYLASRTGIYCENTNGSDIRFVSALPKRHPQHRYAMTLDPEGRRLFLFSTIEVSIYSMLLPSLPVRQVRRRLNPP